MASLDKPPAMSITVHPATAADAPDMALIESRAFNGADRPADDPSWGRIMFGQPSAEAQAARAADMIDKLEKNPEIKTFKAVVHDPENRSGVDGKTVAFAQWRFYTDPMPAEEWTDQEWKFSPAPDACNAFFGEMTRKRMRIMSGKRFAWMEILAADPDYQRMGIGNKLLQAGFDIADKLGLTEAYIEASQAGYPLYRKWGWEDVDAIIIDKSKYGGKELHNTICMVRKKPLEEK